MKRKTTICNVLNKRIKKINKTENKIQNFDYGIWSDLNTLTYPNNIKNYDDSKDWVSPSNIKNYALNDPILDWLQYYKKNEHKIKKKYNNKLFECGNEFEKKIYKELKNKYPNDIFLNTVSTISREQFDITKKCINNKIPIICQAVLYNDNNKTYGIADLLIRSDWMNKIFEQEQLEKTEINKNYYCVIDIKWSNMVLCVNNINVRNINMMASTKCQLAIYNLALGILQNKINNKAYILCKNSISNDDKSNNYFYKLGHIDYAGFDNQYLELTKNAIYWVRNLRYNGHLWKYNPPTVNELYPNMCNKYDLEYRNKKTDIAKEINELTLLWMVGPKNRKIGHNNGVYSFMDPRCKSNILGINGKNSNVLDKIIEINKNNDKLIYPEKIINNIHNWKIETNDDIYIDFETINTCFIDSTESTNSTNFGKNIIFMIGIGYVKNGKFIYKNFFMKKLIISEEFKIIINAFKYISNITKNPKFFHWGNAEEYNLIYANNKYNSIFNKYLENIKWIDLCKIFKTEPIVIKGAYNFGLKEIAKSMFNNKQIKITWKNNDTSNGLMAMLNAIDFYNGKKINMYTIINYNKIDCQVLYEIVNYLRNY